MANYKDNISAYRRIQKADRPRPNVTESSAAVACELRERAARYRQLAEILHDPVVVAEVLACARELDIDAAKIERQLSALGPSPVQRYRISN